MGELFRVGPAPSNESLLFGLSCTFYGLFFLLWLFGFVILKVKNHVENLGLIFIYNYSK